MKKSLSEKKIMKTNFRFKNSFRNCSFQKWKCTKEHFWMVNSENYFWIRNWLSKLPII